MAQFGSGCLSLGRSLGEEVGLNGFGPTPALPSRDIRIASLSCSSSLPPLSSAWRVVSYELRSQTDERSTHSAIWYVVTTVVQR